MTAWRCLAAGLVLVTSVAAATDHAAAHTGGSTGYATISLGGDRVRYSLALWPSALPPAISAELEAARAGRAESRERLLGYVRDKVTVTAQGRRCEPDRRSVEVPRPPAGPSGSAAPPENVTLAVDFSCREPVHTLGIRDDLFDVFGADYHTLARIDAPGRTTQFAFTPESRETRVSIEGDGGGRGTASFIRLGIEHILTGYDHLLFLLGLLLPGGGVLALTKIITAFTVAHSVTLSLAVLNLVVLPDRLIEAVIALSIAAVAAENLYLTPTVTRRWIVSFCFGLVHGFGFSSALREMSLPSHGLLASLFGFNAGVELGQALVVAAALPLMAALRRTGHERRMVWGSSMAILLVGLALFVERVWH